jgi:hypothetical protein
MMGQLRALPPGCPIKSLGQHTRTIADKYCLFTNTFTAPDSGASAGNLLLSPGQSREERCLMNARE